MYSLWGKTHIKLTLIEYIIKLRLHDLLGTVIYATKYTVTERTKSKVKGCVGNSGSSGRPNRDKD